MYTPLPGQTDLSLLVEGGEPWGATRIHRKLDARWRRVAERMLEKLTPAGYCYLLLSGVSADGETFSINGRVYELDPAGVAAVGDVAITVANGANANVTALAIVAQVNLDAGRDVDALLLSVGAAVECVAFVPRVGTGAFVGDGAAAGFVTADTLGNGAFRTNRAAAALFSGDGNPAAFNECSGTHEVVAGDVAQWLLNGGIAIAAVPFTTAPVRVQYTCQRGAPTDAGAVVVSLATVEFRWRQVNTNRWVLECIDLVPVLQAGDFIHWTAST
jgi:hypothetical protein